MKIGNLLLTVGLLTATTDPAPVPSVWVQLLDRKQQRLELALIPVTEFMTPAHYPAAPAQTPHAPEQVEEQVNKVTRKLYIAAKTTDY